MRFHLLLDQVHRRQASCQRLIKTQCFGEGLIGLPSLPYQMRKRPTNPEALQPQKSILSLVAHDGLGEVRAGLKAALRFRRAFLPAFPSVRHSLTLSLLTSIVHQLSLCIHLTLPKS
jgi:hypothetical protein